MLAMMLFPHSGYATSIASFVGALLTTLAIYALAYMADSSRTTIILAGITVSSFLNAGINTIKLINTDITLNITSFLMGTLSGLTFNKICAGFPAQPLCAVRLPLDRMQSPALSTASLRRRAYKPQYGRSTAQSSPPYAPPKP